MKKKTWSLPVLFMCAYWHHRLDVVLLTLFYKGDFEVRSKPFQQLCDRRYVYLQIGTVMFSAT